MNAGNQRGGQPELMVDNEVYNILMTLTNKLQALAVYDTYQQDGQVNDSLWQDLRQQDDQAVRRLLAQLEQFAQQGRLRPC